MDYLLGWYYAWGGSTSTSGSWAWRIGDGAAHFGYQNPMAAWALTNVPAMAPKGATAATDWTTSLSRQMQFYQWLQSSEGAFAGGATNSWGGNYGTPPSGDSTFYGMFYTPNPVYDDPPSNNWFGMQAWSGERLAEYYYTTGDADREGHARQVGHVGVRQHHDQRERDVPDPGHAELERATGHVEPDHPGGEHEPARHRHRPRATTWAPRRRT